MITSSASCNNIKHFQLAKCQLNDKVLHWNFFYKSKYLITSRSGISNLYHDLISWGISELWNTCWNFITQRKLNFFIIAIISYFPKQVDIQCNLSVLCTRSLKHRRLIYINHLIIQRNTLKQLHVVIYTWLILTYEYHK